MNDLMFKNLLIDYINDPENSDLNFSLALYYYSIGQTASAVSFFIRTAERTKDDLQKYECLLMAAKCFEHQGSRAFSVKGLLQHALSLFPKRPEAYFLLAKYYEGEKKDGSWFDCYMISSIGLNVVDFSSIPLSIDVDYPGKYALLFQKALSSWWCGLCEESRTLFIDLLKNYTMEEQFKVATINNLKMFGAFNTKKINYYTKDKHKHLRINFNDSELIEKNYSESYQDMFVLTMLGGKKNGHYVEIGAGNSFYGSNTALLEQQYNWKGVSIDFNEDFVASHARERKNLCVLRDATLINYDKFLSALDFPTTIDYLQIDCDPSETSYKILTTIPFEKYKFAVITYEHDDYSDVNNVYKEKSRKYLSSYGYVMVVGDIAPDDWRNYEDWWVHPDLINPSILSAMLSASNLTKNAEEYMFDKLNDKKV